VHRLDTDSCLARAPFDESIEAINGEIHIPISRNRRLKLEKVCASKRAERNQLVHLFMVETMPNGSIQTFQFDVGNDGAYAKSLAWEIDSKLICVLTLPKRRVRKCV